MTKYEHNASFLSAVEASLCARNQRAVFWDALAYLLERRDRNGMYSIREAIEDIQDGKHIKYNDLDKKANLKIA